MKDIDKEVTDLIMQEVYSDDLYKEGLKYVRKIKNPMILDVGAYIGITPIYFNVPGAMICAVEANPQTYECLLENVKQYPNINPVNCFLGSSKMLRTMYKPAGSVAMSAYRETGVTYDEKILVRGMTFDELYEDHIMKPIDLMKIDIEGGEYDLFLSPEFEKYADKISMIVGESHNNPIRHEFLPQILEKLGFKV